MKRRTEHDSYWQVPLTVGNVFDQVVENESWISNSPLSIKKHCFSAFGRLKIHPNVILNIVRTTLPSYAIRYVDNDNSWVEVTFKEIQLSDSYHQRLDDFRLLGLSPFLNGCAKTGRRAREGIKRWIDNLVNMRFVPSIIRQILNKSHVRKSRSTSRVISIRELSLSMFVFLRVLSTSARCKEHTDADELITINSKCSAEQPLRYAWKSAKIYLHCWSKCRHRLDTVALLQTTVLRFLPLYWDPLSRSQRVRCIW